MDEFTAFMGVTIFSSMLYNTVLNIGLYKSAKKQAIEKLEYDELSRPAKKELRKMKRVCFQSIVLDLGTSLIPLYNVYQSISLCTNYDEIKEVMDNSYDKIVENANEKEDLTRSVYLKTLRDYKDYLENLEPDIKKGLEDDNYRPSKKTFNKALRHLNMRIKEE